MPAMDPVGRRIDELAQAMYDAKFVAPQDNMATHPVIAERAVQHVTRFMRIALAQRTRLDDKMAVFYGLWNGQSASFYFPQSRHVHVPEPFKAVEAAVPRLAEILTGPYEWFRFVGIDKEGKKNADIRTKLVRSQLRMDGFKRKLRTILRDTCIYGWSGVKTRWKMCRRKVKYNRVEELPHMEDGVAQGTDLTVKQAEVEVNLDGPTIEPVDVFRFFTDMRHHDHQTGPGVCTETDMPEHELREYGKRGVFANVDNLIKGEATPTSGQTQGPVGTHMNPATFREIRDRSNGVDYAGDHRAPVTREYEIYEFWGMFDPEYDETTNTQGEQKEYCILLGRQKQPKTTHSGSPKSGYWPLLICENPYWHGQRPVLASHYIRRSQSFASKGVIEPIVKLSAELDDLRNMGLAGTSLSSKPFFVVDDDADIGANNVIIEAGSVLRCRRTDSIKPMFAPDRSQVAYMGETICKADIAETTGIPKLMEGSREGKETATSTVSRTREANKRMTEAAQNIAEHFLKPMLEQWDSMNSQMITQERLVEIIGEDGLTADIRKVGPADLAGRVHVEVTTLPQMEMAGIEARMLMNFAGAAANFMQLDPGMMNVEPLMRRAYEKTWGHVGIEEVFPRMDKPTKLRSVPEEHQLIAMGHELQPQAEENTNMHLRGHRMFMQSPTFAKWEPDAKIRLVAHTENTYMEMRRQMEEMGPQLGLPIPGAPPGAQTGGRPVVPGAAMQRGAAPTPQGQVRSQIASVEPRTPALEE